MKHTLDSYEENIQLDSPIMSILFADFSNAKKHKKLTQLQESVHSDLAKSHVEYYKKYLMNNQRNLYKKICMRFLVGIYLLFIIYLIAFRIYPEKTHTQFTLPFTNIESTWKSAILEADTDWYKDYHFFRSITDSTNVEVICQNDIMLCLSISNGILNWYFDIEPTEITPDGKLIYKNEYYITLTYYPDTHHIYIHTTDGLMKGEYAPIET